MTLRMMRIVGLRLLEGCESGLHVGGGDSIGYGDDEWRVET
jgi:hypothetical protein